MNENLFISRDSICTIDKDTQNCIGCVELEMKSQNDKLSHTERMEIMKRLGYGKRKIEKAY